MVAIQNEIITDILLKFLESSDQNETEENIQEI